MLIVVGGNVGIRAEIQLHYDGVLTFLRPNDRKFIKSGTAWSREGGEGEAVITGRLTASGQARVLRGNCGYLEETEPPRVSY